MGIVIQYASEHKLGCAATTASHSDRCTSLGDRAEPRARRLRSRETSDPVASQTYFLDHDLCCC